MRIYESPDMQPCGQYIPDHFLAGNEPPSNGEKDVALLRYFDKPKPANDNRSVIRFVPDYGDYCSSRQRYSAVRLPRVSMIDGPSSATRSYAEAA